MDYGCYANSLHWNAIASSGQPGDLRTQWHWSQHHDHSNPSERDMMNIDFPFHFDSRGLTAATDDNDHIRDMIEEFLFTNPGERVNRPDFGAGLLQLIFAPNSPELAAAVQFTVQAGLQRWLSDVIEVRGLEVTSEDSTLRVVVQYLVKRTGEQQTQTFEKAAA
jgi:phage baseplate assembly protein W